MRHRFGQHGRNATLGRKRRRQAFAEARQNDGRHGVPCPAERGDQFVAGHDRHHLVGDNHGKVAGVGLIRGRADVPSANALTR